MKSGNAHSPGQTTLRNSSPSRVRQKKPSLAPLGVQVVLLVDLHAGVGDRHHPEAVRAQLRDQAGGVREPLAVPGEHAVAVHVVDVEVEHVARDLACAELARDREHLVRAHVRPPRLLVAERPQRRHRRAAGQRRVAVEHVGGRRAEQHVDHEVVGGLDRHAVRVGLGEVELDPPRMVVEHAVRTTVVQAQHERDRRVEVVEGGGVPGRRVDVPEHLPRGGLLEPGGPLAAAEVPLERRPPLHEARRTKRPAPRPRNRTRRRPRPTTALPAGVSSEPSEAAGSSTANDRSSGRPNRNTPSATAVTSMKADTLGSSDP